ncbi:MAG: hypothetical protein JOY69_10430 [Candidatus Eremiobacteraeota bacterium]|nr:hypothetical protein [Candidatus Eremiobacteraeota bacterium]
MAVMIAIALVIASIMPPAAEDVQTPGSNITVTTCHAQLDPPPLRIIYANTASVAATEVDFEIVDSAGTIETVVDRGNFTTGKPINHVFGLPPNVSPLGLSSARCTVTKVMYADGTTWSKPSGP